MGLFKSIKKIVKKVAPIGGAIGGAIVGIPGGPVGILKGATTGASLGSAVSGALGGKKDQAGSTTQDTSSASTLNQSNVQNVVGTSQATNNTSANNFSNTSNLGTVEQAALQQLAARVAQNTQQFSRTAAIADTQGAVNSIGRQLREQAIPQILSQASAAGAYNSTGAQALGNDALARGTEVAGQLQLDQINKYAGLQQAGLTDAANILNILKGANVSTSGGSTEATTATGVNTNASNTTVNQNQNATGAVLNAGQGGIGGALNTATGILGSAGQIAGGFSDLLNLGPLQAILGKKTGAIGAPLAGEPDQFNLS